jgi:hypothetical protein
MNYNIILEDVYICKNDIERVEDNKLKKFSNFSDEKIFNSRIYDFMDISHNSLLSLVDITKYILKYIQANNLNNKKTIKLDLKLKNLFDINDIDHITYLNIQKHIYKLSIV